MKPGRNSLCDCGSGKKYKRCCLGQPTPASSQVITFKFSEPASIRSVSMGPDGQLALNGEDGVPVEPEYYAVTTSRSRTSGSPKPKVLGFSVGVGEMAQMDPSRILEGYDHVFFVDTNSVGGGPGNKRLAVTMIVLATVTKNADTVGVQYAPIVATEWREVTCDPERLGWQRAIRGIMANPEYSDRKKILMVVDSSLGSLAVINDGKEPIIDDFFLPKGFRLSYASADTGQQHLPNKIMRYCDQEAARLIKVIEAGTGNPGPLHPSDVPHASQARTWTPQERTQ